MSRSLGITLNALGLYGIALVLAAAFVVQFLLNELPCPLCLLQRVQFAMLAIGPILNVRLGPRPRHYALSLLAACAGAVVAARQILLHILPDDPGYGTALLGYHFYTWAFMGFAAAIVAIAVVLLFDSHLHDDSVALPLGLFATGAVWLVIGLTVLNVIATLLECGFGSCPDNPTSYKLL